MLTQVLVTLAWPFLSILPAYHQIWSHVLNLLLVYFLFQDDGQSFQVPYLLCRNMVHRYQHKATWDRLFVLDISGVMYKLWLFRLCTLSSHVQICSSNSTVIDHPLRLIVHLWYWSGGYMMLYYFCCLYPSGCLLGYSKIIVTVSQMMNNSTVYVLGRRQFSFCDIELLLWYDAQAVTFHKVQIDLF